MNNLADTNSMLTNIAILTVFKNFLTDEIGIKFVIFLEGIKENAEFAHLAELYSDFVSALYGSKYRGHWSSFVENFVLKDNNPVSIECAKGAAHTIPAYIMGAFEFELRILSDIASVAFEDIREVLMAHYPDEKDAINSLPVFGSTKLLFTKDKIQDSYKTNGYGIISEGRAFKFENSLELKPVYSPDETNLNDLKLYDYQKNIILKNTKAFINGAPANNILLYGDRGCGKSSLVKATANKFKDAGLKIVLVCKENLPDIEELFEYLSNFPSKFIIFIDDLTFDESDPLFASCKTVLEGSLSKHPNNVIIYATTNRRHLIKESFTSREGSEVHLNDTMDEAASLSDRFGITITFSSPDKTNYLEIVKQLADEAHLEYEQATLFREAEAFALLKGNRAPRIARQFLTDYAAKSFA